MKVTITALAPLHFGASPMGLTTLDYAFLNNKCYILSEDRLLKAIAAKGATDEFVDWVQQPPPPPQAPPPPRSSQGRDRRPPSRPPRRPSHRDITSFLRRHGMLKDADLEAMSRYLVPARVQPSGEVRILPRTVHGDPYLPGSALKGVMRIAVAYQLLKAMPEPDRKRLLDDFLVRRMADCARGDRGRRRPEWLQERYRQSLARELDGNLFRCFRLNSSSGRATPNTDVFRALRVADSKPIDQGSVSICEVRVHSAYSRQSPKTWSILAECVWIGAAFELDVQVDEALLDTFARYNSGTGYGLPFAAVADWVRRPLDAAAGLAADLYAEEQRFFEQDLGRAEAVDLRGETPSLRIGWGTTMLGSSVSMLLPASLRRDLRNDLFQHSGDTPAPKSRKLVEIGGNVFSLGWAKVQSG